MKNKKIEEVWIPTFKKVSFLFFFNKEVPNGWEDLGEVGAYIGKSGESEYPLCSNCTGFVRVGKTTNNLFFWYCPRCKVQRVDAYGTRLVVDSKTKK